VAVSPPLSAEPLLIELKEPRNQVKGEKPLNKLMRLSHRRKRQRPKREAPEQVLEHFEEVEEPM